MSASETDGSGRNAAGFVLLGAIEIVAGVLYLGKALVFGLLSVPGIVHLPPGYGGEEVPATAAVALPPAIFFLAIGFGSIVARRWARALSLAFAALWLGGGAIVAAFLLPVLPRVFAALRTVPAAARPALSLSPPLRAEGAIVFLGVLLPAAFVLFYGSAGARRESERRDPEERWTDRVPLPALATAMVLAIGALLAIDIAFAPSRQLLLFGRRLPPAGKILVAVAAGVEIAVAWAVCRLDRRAGIAAAAIIAIRGAIDVAMALRVGRSGLAGIVRLEPSVTAEARSAVARLEPLRLPEVAAACLAVLAASAFAVAVRAAIRLRRVPPAA